MNFLLREKLQRWKGSRGGLRAGEAEMNCRSKIIHRGGTGVRRAKKSIFNGIELREKKT
jgi:hypothetical protein